MLSHNASPALVATLQAVAQIAPALYTGMKEKKKVLNLEWKLTNISRLHLRLQPCRNPTNDGACLPGNSRQAMDASLQIHPAIRRPAHRIRHFEQRHTRLHFCRFADPCVAAVHSGRHPDWQHRSIHYAVHGVWHQWLGEVEGAGDSGER